MSDAATEWSAVAAAWDRHVDEVDENKAPGTRELLDALAVQSGERVLELACGPGSLGRVWSDLVGPTGSVTLSDVAPGMVEVARRRNSGLDNVAVAVLDAAAIDLPDGSVDAVACRMGLMFVPDPAAAFAEVRRVLAPGGRFAAMTWGALEDNPWVTCVAMAAMVNGIVTGGPPVGPGTIFSLADPADLEALAKGAGFEDVSVVPQPVVFEAPGVAEHVARVSSMAGPIAAAIDAATDEQRDALVRTASDLAAEYVTDDGLRVPGRALLVTGRS